MAMLSRFLDFLKQSGLMKVSWIWTLPTFSRKVTIRAAVLAQFGQTIPANGVNVMSFAKG